MISVLIKFTVHHSLSNTGVNIEIYFLKRLLFLLYQIMAQNQKYNGQSTLPLG